LLETHAFSEYFEDILSVEQGYPRKPDPAMVLATLEKYALDPAKTLLIGDRDLDIQAGRAAGVRTALFDTSGLTISADIRITHYNQLLEILSTQRISDPTKEQE
jgi:phosphoglycolate phosphatase-like HAD superfamily hydrolase